MTTNAPNPPHEQSELEYGYIKVQLDYAPKTNGKKFKEWCAAHNFDYLASGRRAWCSYLRTYLRDAAGVAYNDGEPFLFYEDDLVDIDALISQATQEATVEAFNYSPKTLQKNPEHAEAWIERQRDMILAGQPSVEGEQS